MKNSLLFSKVSVPSRLFTVQCIHLAEVLILTDYLAEKEENDTYYVDSSASSQCTNFSSTQIGFSNGGFGQRPPPPYLNSPSQLREYNLSRGRGFGARGSTWAGRFATSTHIHQQENRYFFVNSRIVIILESNQIRQQSPGSREITVNLTIDNLMNQEIPLPDRLFFN